jgi:DNA-binding PadR family transcriptional regulator
MKDSRNKKEEKIPMLTPHEALILQLVIAAGTMYGLELVEQSEGKLKRGTVYVTLNRMEEKGYIESEQEAESPVTGGLPRRFYKATGYGQRVLQGWELMRSFMAGHPAKGFAG